MLRDMVVLLRLEELPGGRRRDEYLGMFANADAAREYLLTVWVRCPLLWKACPSGSGGFESVCLCGLRPKTVLRAIHTVTVDFTILEFS